MKKLLLLAIVGAAGYFGFRKVQAGKAEEDLWKEATAPVDLT